MKSTVVSGANECVINANEPNLPLGDICQDFLKNKIMHLKKKIDRLSLKHLKVNTGFFVY